MARTHRAHLSKTALAKRGGKQSPEEREKSPRDKSHKQRRVNERAKIKREYL